MKIAGRKNDGAWYRNNRAIQSLNDTEKANLAGCINGSLYIDAAFAALLGIAAEVGVTGLGAPTTADEWATTMANVGIPRQIWMGHLSWTTYTEDDDGVLRGNGQSAIHFFGKDLRRICKRYFLVRRQTRDLFDLGGALEGNPGGLPDANPES